MKSEAIDWDADLSADPGEEYQALLRALRRTRGFGLLFVRCSRSKAKQLLQDINKDLPQKSIKVLRFEQSIINGNLYKQVEEYLGSSKLTDILFIQGLEFSLYDYEETQRRLSGWSSDDTYSYSWKGVPHILTNLNQQRERFRDNFNTCFVFLVPLFVFKYIIHRAPDFFDWRSGVYAFSSDPETLEQESQRIIGANHEEYLRLIPQQRYQKLLRIQELLEEKHQTSERRAQLFFEQGNLFMVTQDNEAAIASYDKTLDFKTDDYEAWYNRGIALCNLERHEEAIASFSKALKLKPDKHEAWYERGKALRRLERYEEAIANYDNALRLKPDYYEAWYGRGRAFRWLGRYEEAIASYDNALKLKPDYCKAWYSRGRSLKRLERYKEAVDSFNEALKLEPDNYLAWYNKGNALVFMKRYEEAIASYEKALEIKSDKSEAWNNRGNVLAILGHYEEAIESFDKSLEYSPDDARAFYNKACCYAVWRKPEKVIENLQRSIHLNPNKYREMARTDSDFDSIRDDERFQALLQR
ncbi:MAG: tetratricopeptide repeat protein [Leptolyngbyaceae cyanobacterium RM2_2_4]|nr:tetratricopeptide repeat protein [Leptolyngbyaceae cyanobacterium RM2_2_4]